MSKKEIEEINDEASFLDIKSPKIKAGSVIVWPENKTALLLFLKVQTQWNTAPMGGIVGLNYQVVLAILELYFPDSRTLRVKIFKDIQAIEAGYLKGINSKKP